MKQLTLMTISFACLFLCSCNDSGLSKNLAKKQILEKVKFPITKSNQYFIMHTPQEPFLAAGLIQNGNCECYNNSCPELTSKGKEYVIKTIAQPPCDDYYTVKIADVEFGDISEILFTNESKSAEVFYTIHEKSTPFRKILDSLEYKPSYPKDTVVEYRAVFIKNNDEWKINDAQLKSHPK